MGQETGDDASFLQLPPLHNAPGPTALRAMILDVTKTSARGRVIALPQGTVTFLFTDIEGSTRLLQLLGEDYAKVLAIHHKRLREVFEHHHGSALTPVDRARLDRWLERPRGELGGDGFETAWAQGRPYDHRPSNRLWRSDELPVSNSQNDARPLQTSSVERLRARARNLSVPALLVTFRLTSKEPLGALVSRRPLK